MEPSEPEPSLDAPIAGAEADALDRWPLAESLANVICSSGSAVHAGVLGAWGSGKTSLLNLLEESIRARKHFAVRYSAWGCRDVEHALGQLATAVERTVAAGGVSLERTDGARRMTGLVRRAATKIGGVLGLGADLLLERLGSAGTALRAAREAAGDIKIVVLVDDLDRTDPQLVETLLFALHEVLANEGYSSVLAMDDHIVARGLARRLEATETDALLILEKFLHIAIRLPTPTKEQVLELATRHVRRHCPHVPPAALADEIDALPTEPRALKGLLRALLLLEAEIRRHRPDEIRWPLVILLEALRYRFPSLFEALIESDEALRSFTYGGKESRFAQPLDEQMADQVSKLPDDVQSEANQLLRRMSGRRC